MAVAILLASPVLNFAQISSVNYQVKFNAQTNLFDCYLIVKEGNTNSVSERAQFNSQLTLVIPSGSNISLKESYMPIQNNQKYNGNIAQSWILTNIRQSPSIDVSHDYVSFVPNLSPTSFYNDLKSGDQVKLFSVSITPIESCGSEIKLFDNITDPSSRSNGMYGGDFSNGFTIGGITPKYAGNEDIKIPSINVVKNMDAKRIKNDLSIYLEIASEANYGPFTFEWTLPNGQKRTTKDLSVKNAQVEDGGTYKVLVTDNRGCVEIRSIDLPVSPIAVDKTNPSTPSEIAMISNSRTKSIESKITVYPNPASTFFNLNVEGVNGLPVSADITDLTGRVVRSNILNSIISNESISSVISLENMLPGLYNIKVITGDKTSTHKLIIIK